MTEHNSTRALDIALPTTVEIERAMQRGRKLRSKAANDALSDLVSELRRLIVDARRGGAPQPARRAV